MNHSPRYTYDLPYGHAPVATQFFDGGAEASGWDVQVPAQGRDKRKQTGQDVQKRAKSRCLMIHLPGEFFR